MAGSEALLSNRKLVMDGKSNCSGESPKPHILTVLKELHKAPGYFRYKTVWCGVANMLQDSPCYIALSLRIKLNTSEIKVECAVVCDEETTSIDTVSSESAELLH
jgi:hypothetical protein